MNITTKLDQEIWHDMQEAGAYEWWYFDAEDTLSGISLVLIWFSGFPFSPYYTNHYEKWKKRITSIPPHPSDYSGFSFQLYEHGREIINFIKEGEAELFDSSHSAIGVRFENNSFTYNSERDEYLLDIDFSFPVRHKKVKAALVFKVVRRVVYEKKDANNNGKVPLHQWLLSVPKAEVYGNIEIISQPESRVLTLPVSGTGYHDHNLGAMPMQEYISRWYWGRAFSGRFDLIYYVVFFRNDDYQPLSLLLIQDNVKKSAVVHDAVHFSESNFRKGLFSPHHSRDLEVHYDTSTVRIHHNKVLDSGPFYLRFESKISLQADGCCIEDVQGISEFLNPVRLQSRFMRFITCCRIWRMGEESIMYKSYNGFKRSLHWNNQ